MFLASAMLIEEENEVTKLYLDPCAHDEKTDYHTSIADYEFLPFW